MRRSVIVSAVLAIGFVLAGCASSPAGPPTVDPSDAGAASGAGEQPATVGDGSPLSAFPLCDEFNQMDVDQALGVISLATGTEYNEETGWDFMANVQSNCSIQGWGDMSVLRAIIGGLTDGQKLQVAWSLNTAAGAWGGFSFPAEFDGFRLVGEDEYNEFRLMRPEICPSMQDLGDSLVTESATGLHVQAYYTKFDGPIGPADACDWGSETLIVSFVEDADDAGWFSLAAKQPNGVFCQNQGITTCAVKTGKNDTWLAVDRIEATSVEQLSGFLKAVLDAQ